MGNPISGTPTTPPRGPSTPRGEPSLHRSPGDKPSEEKETASAPSTGSPNTTETFDLWTEPDSASPAPPSPGSISETPEQDFESVSEPSGALQAPPISKTFLLRPKRRCRPPLGMWKGLSRGSSLSLRLPRRVE